VKVALESGCAQSVKLLAGVAGGSAVGVRSGLGLVGKPTVSLLLGV